LNRTGSGSSVIATKSRPSRPMLTLPFGTGASWNVACAPLKIARHGSVANSLKRITPSSTAAW
jgi:hypothetical protein